MKYVPPLTKDGKIQYVPVVVKNKDTLIGIIDTLRNLIHNISDLIDLKDESILMRLSPDIDSTRFNNYIDDGVDGTDLTEEEEDEIMENNISEVVEHESAHPENKESIFHNNYFMVDCNCGYSVIFRTPKEIPTENCKCELCDRTLIHYIHVDDEDLEFDEGKD